MNPKPLPSISRASRIAVFVSVLLFAIVPAALGRTSAESPKPIPLGWKIVIIAVVLAAAGATIFYAVRTWRSWNLFDRQYRFPLIPPVPQRLGASRTGGLLATIVFDGTTGSEQPGSGSKDF